MDYFFRGLGARDLFLINCGRCFGIFAVAVFVDSGGGVDAVIASGRAERLTRHHSDANETTMAGVRTREGRRIHNALEYSIYRMQSALHE